MGKRKRRPLKKRKPRCVCVICGVAIRNARVNQITCSLPCRREHVAGLRRARERAYYARDAAYRARRKAMQAARAAKRLAAVAVLESLGLLPVAGKGGPKRKK